MFCRDIHRRQKRIQYGEMDYYKKVTKTKRTWLLNLIRRYIKDREIYVTGYEKTMTHGVPQGYILGPMLWTMCYTTKF